MWQSFIANLARNPLALKALAEVVAPPLRSLLKQETGEDFAQLRRDVDAVAGLTSREIPLAINGLGARQAELAQAVESLRQEVRDLAARQSERESSLAAQVARLSQELAQARGELQKAQEAGALPAPRRWRPW